MSTLDSNRRGFFRALAGVAIAPVALSQISDIPAAAVAPRGSMLITRDILEDALRLIGVLSPGELASDADMVFCYRMAARLRETWPYPNLGRTFVFAVANDLQPIYSPRRPKIGDTIRIIWPQRFLPDENRAFRCAFDFEQVLFV